jgi:hypothetical protein
MKKQLLIGILFCCILIQAQSLNKNYYRVGMITADSVKLEHNQILKKGCLVQIITKNNTEEGTFVKTKTDSGFVYSTDIKFLVFVKDTLITFDIASSKKIKLIPNQTLLFEKTEGDSFLVSMDEFLFKIKKSKLFFDNKEFFTKIVE